MSKISDEFNSFEEEMYDYERRILEELSYKHLEIALNAIYGESFIYCEETSNIREKSVRNKTIDCDIGADAIIHSYLKNMRIQDLIGLRGRRGNYSPERLLIAIKVKDGKVCELSKLSALKYFITFWFDIENNLSEYVVLKDLTRLQEYIINRTIEFYPDDDFIEIRFIDLVKHDFVLIRMNEKRHLH